MPSVIAEIKQWANSLPYWEQAALDKILLGTPLTNVDYGELVDYLLDDAGLVLFNYEFSGSKTRVNEMLIGGILTVLQSSMAEIIGSRKQFEQIQLGDVHILGKPLNSQYLLLLRTERSSRFINQILHHFSQEFVKIYGNQLDGRNIINTKDYQDADKLVEKYFAIKGAVKEFHQKQKQTLPISPSS